MFRNVNVSFTLHQEYAHNAVCPEKLSFHSGGDGRGRGGELSPLFLNFQDPPLASTQYRKNNGSKI